MSLFWSPIPVDVVFAGQFAQVPELHEVHIGEATMLCTPVERGMGRVERLISPHAEDYLKAEWQPGAYLPLWGNS